MPYNVVADLARWDHGGGFSRQVTVLRLPGEMTERCKAIAFAKDYLAGLRGFAVRDLRHTL